MLLGIDQSALLFAECMYVHEQRPENTAHIIIHKHILHITKYYAMFAKISLGRLIILD